MNKPSKTKPEAASQGCCLKGTPKERQKLLAVGLQLYDYDFCSEYDFLRKYFSRILLKFQHNYHYIFRI